jgi:glycogen debranching enzyme
MDPQPATTADPKPPPAHGAATHDPFYILATSPLADESTRVLKEGDTFGVFDHYGDIKPAGMGEEGLYHEGTRFVSCLLLRLGNDRPLFLSSTVKEENDLLAIDLTNPDVYVDGRLAIPRGTLHIFRSKFLWQGTCYERLRIKNYGLGPVQAQLFLRLDADFADIFEVRGSRRPRRGRALDRVVDHDTMALSYEGLDGVTRTTRVHFSPGPAAVNGPETRFDIALQAKGEEVLHWTVSCEGGAAPPRPLPYDNAFTAACRHFAGDHARTCKIDTTNDQFNDWLNRTVADLNMMTTETPEGPYPYAGVPWFSTAFGRDGIITALECLWLRPELARGVLAYLAATQADTANAEQDAEPGKILHETRRGEMAALHEIPFGRYYGSVDATPLFVLLAGAYYERTGDRPFLEGIWPNIERALRWIDVSGDSDGDGFVEYLRRSPTGLVQQGWKDSHDSVFHADGTLAHGPIALCEVQGYVYEARRRAAELAAVLGHVRRAEELDRQAETLRERFEHAFWCEELGTYALALDGDKRPCRVRASNAGHCLFTGIAGRDRARRAAETLLADDAFSGWGIRTVSAAEVRYNPMSYHNGSVWPHDNALIAHGLARYGFQDLVLKVMTGFFDASLFVDLHRLPELFCGFHRRPGEGPTLYPVACAPQSWAAASVFMLLQACLGLGIRAPQAQICFSHPVLPAFLKEVCIRDLEVGDGSVDFLLQRRDHDVGINVLRRQGNVAVAVAL